jgi:hypothetical protein
VKAQMLKQQRIRLKLLGIRFEEPRGIYYIRNREKLVQKTNSERSESNSIRPQTEDL